jgi:hypothetical protein
LVELIQSASAPHWNRYSPTSDNHRSTPTITDIANIG